MTVERRDGTVALVRIDRPRANALSTDPLVELHRAVDDLTADLPGAVVRWGGPRIFAAGARSFLDHGPGRAVFTGP